MKIKLCGLRRAEDIDYANECRPDYAGFVFAAGRRRVSAAQAAKWRARLSPEIKAVGVFVNETPKTVLETAKRAGLDVIQLHGDEDAAYIGAIKAEGLAVWKAVRVRGAKEIRQAEELGADMLLLDSFVQDVYGGTGKTADWELIARACPRKPFFLAGGLNRDNVREAVRRLAPCGVDLSGGIETGGIKDRDKMMEIMQILRGM